jgi:glutamate N-acetyltransferase/amino-acid N-acetyltransferase
MPLSVLSSTPVPAHALPSGLRWVGGGVTAAAGFLAHGLAAGIKKSRKPDLALVVSESMAACAGTLTSNRVKAAPVVVSLPRLRAGRAKAVILNSGNANCLTGAPGLADARAMGRAAAQALGVAESAVLVASTGIIGRRLAVDRIVAALPELARGLSRPGSAAAARAIMTTDTVPKEAAVASTISGRACHVGGMAKGAGMIMPGMATMLCVITTDAAVDRPLLAALVREAVDGSFNRISVDGDMSTNDTVFVLANGASGVRVRAGTPAARRLAAMLRAVMDRLAHFILRDGEGVTRLARVEVTNARTDGEALACARQIANSPLVKTMLASGDPNVGRLAAAVGASPARFDPDRLEVRIDGRVVVSGGAVRQFSDDEGQRLLAPRQLAIQVNLRAGRGRAFMWMCDLTEAYVHLNARYTT